MDRMLVVVVDTEAKAVEATNALLELDGDGSISVYERAIVTKNANGTTTVKLEDERGPLATLAGTELGSLIGLISGPAGLAAGAAVGLFAGAALDIHKARINDDFVDDVAKQLRPGRFALVAEIEEDSTTPVDSRMESIGGIVFRRTLSDVQRTLREEHLAAMQANLMQMKAELAQIHADRKAKLQEKINELDSKIQEQLRRSNERREEAELAEKAKAEALQARAEAQEAKAAETHIQDELHK
ncbi:MAG TPA: DUF1269 domain-containing protein [Terriglobales bacterium]|nr:DUF1269 domain-containing protein [Terriglobales bacterium]